MPRAPRKGIVLISALLSLILVTGLTLTLQAQALASTKSAKRLAALQAEALGRDAVRALTRPLIGAAMLGEESPVALDGIAYPVGFDGREYAVQVRVIDPRGWTAGSGAQARKLEVSLD